MSDVRKESMSELAKRFELSILAPMKQEQFMELMNQAKEYNLQAVFVAPFYVPDMKKFFAGTDILVSTGMGFPLGYEDAEAKALEAKNYVDMGADTLDFVMNYPALMAGHPEIVDRECALIRRAVPDTLLKMILEVCNLTDDQIRQAIKIAADNGIEFIKSSTGQLAGPTFRQTCLIVDEAGKYGLRTKVAGVKAPRPQNAMVYLAAGIERIGSQHCIEILDGIKDLRDRGIF